MGPRLSPNAKRLNSLKQLQHREGIVRAYLQLDELGKEAMEALDLSDFPRIGIESLWSDESEQYRNLKKSAKGYRFINVLDSFFSDTLIHPVDVRRPMIERALQGVPIKFLLADPYGAFGKARAEAIGQNAVRRSREGFVRLAQVCNDLRHEADSHWRSLDDEIESIGEDWRKAKRTLLKAIDGLPIEVRLYSISPSGPLYFFSHLLFAGRFWSVTSAASPQLPWEQIIDTPFENDLYDIMLTEFYGVWNGAKELSSHGDEEIHSGHQDISGSVFISYCSNDTLVVQELSAMLEERGISTYAFATDTLTGKLWPEEVRQQLLQCGVLVPIFTTHSLDNSDWMRAEIGAAWVMRKHIMQARVGVKTGILPGILDGHQWTTDITSSTGKRKLVDDICKAMGK